MPSGQPRRPEHWRCDAGEADIAVLNIPAALDRTRVFEVDARMVVAVPADASEAWHALNVEIDGRSAWSRRVASSNPGQTDSLEYHCRITLGPGRALRVRAATQVRGAARRRLEIDAREELEAG